MNGRRLIFYFYAVPDMESNAAYKMHFACLKRYSHLFESAKFFIALDDTNDTELAAKAASKIVSCGFVENTEFHIIKNDVYREAGTFKEEIVDKMDSLSGLTFFAHTKGVSNILNPEYDRESILLWIFGCYYLSLENIDNVHTLMQVFQPFDQRFFYGSFLKEIKEEDGGGTRYGAEYEGTFYWINCLSLSRYLKENNIPVPYEIGRFYAERFPGDIFPVSLRTGSEDLKYLLWNAPSLYNNCKDIIYLLVSTEKADTLLKEFNKIISEYDM